MYKITKLMSEVSDLSQKNAELEFSKKKYIEKNKQLTNESKNLAGIIESLKSEVENFKKDAKSVRLAKKNNSVILERKIIELGNKIQEQKLVIDTLQREISDLKGGNGSQARDRFEDFEEIVEMPVKAKPMLFGAIDDLVG